LRAPPPADRSVGIGRTHRFAAAAAPLIEALADRRPFPGSRRIVSARPASPTAPLDATIGKHDLPANRRDPFYEPHAQVDRIEPLRERVNNKRLLNREQLPEIDGDRVVLQWDFGS